MRKSTQNGNGFTEEPWEKGEDPGKEKKKIIGKKMRDEMKKNHLTEQISR